MSNKGLRLMYCKECKRKRYCKKIPIPNYNFRYVCSQGHWWEIVGVTLERINAAWTDIIGPTIKNLFERNDTFYRSIKK